MAFLTLHTGWLRKNATYPSQARPYSFKPVSLGEVRFRSIRILQLQSKPTPTIPHIGIQNEATSAHHRQSRTRGCCPNSSGIFIITDYWVKRSKPGRFGGRGRRLATISLLCNFDSLTDSVYPRHRGTDIHDHVVNSEAQGQRQPQQMILCFGMLEAGINR
jgi:hypothetical protein